MFEKVGRLREMSGNELAHRLREKIRQEVDRVRYRICVGMTHDVELDALISAHGSSFKSYLRQGPASRFYASTQDRDKTSRFMAEHFPECVDRAIREGMRLSEHRLNILGQENVELGQDIDW